MIISDFTLKLETYFIYNNMKYNKNFKTFVKVVYPCGSGGSTISTKPPAIGTLPS